MYMISDLLEDHMLFIIVSFTGKMAKWLAARNIAKLLSNVEIE